MFEVVQIVTPTGKVDDVLKINNTSDTEISYTFGDILELDSEYTFSCWMRGETSTNTEIHISTKLDTFDLTSEWTKVVFTATSNINTSKEVRFTIPVGATVYAYQGQLEIGNKATDFSTNPDDVKESVDNVNDQVIILQTNFSIQQGQIDTLISETTINGESLKDRYLQTVETVNGINTTVGNVQTSINEITGDVEAIDSRITEVETTANGIKTTVTQNQGKWNQAATDATNAINKVEDLEDRADSGEFDGKGVQGTPTVTYQAGTSATTVPTGNWTSTIPNVPVGQYLWSKTVITYTDGTSSTIYGVNRNPTNGTKGDKGDTGNDGKGIANTVHHYLATTSSSGVTTGTAGWTTTPQSVTSTKKYLWYYLTTNYTTGSPTNTTPAIIGVYGDTGGKGDDGKGITSVTPQYYLSTSNTTQSGGSWKTTQDPWSNGKYYWTRDTIKWDDNTTTYTTPMLATALNNANETANQAQTIAEQTADKFTWIVKSGSNETNFELTDRTAQLVAENINLKGLVTFSGLNSETQEKINTAQETAESASETATEANDNVNGVKTIVDQWASDAVNGETTINGGYLKTHTIKSVHLDVNEILAEDGTFMGILQATEINADRITSGTIKANILDVYGLTVRQKDTEVETFRIDSDGDITMRGNVESYNYVSGTSGWSIKSNGDAEFNDVTVRGNLIGDAGGILDVEIDDVLRPVFWAGETYDQRDYAPFIVYNDGSIKATKGTYSGIWTGDIKVGNISIVDPSSSAGGDAIVTIQDGDNGIKKIELTDGDNSYFSQGIQIRDDFYNTSITLSQSGIIQTNNSVLVQDSNAFTQVTPTQISLNGAIVSGQANALSLQTNEVYVDNKSGGGNLTVYGDVFANSRAVVKKELSFNEGIKCTVSTNGIDFTSDIVYTVTFVSNGGTEVNPQTIRYGGYAQRPPDPVRAGYMFNGWYTNSNFTNLWVFSMNTVTDNVTLYAEWLNTPQAPTVVVQQYQVGDNIGGGGRYVRVGCVVTATVDDEDRLGTLSYQWDLKVYNFVDTVVANFPVPASENILTPEQLNMYIGNSEDTSAGYFTVKGTCKVVNTLNGMPVWTTVDIYETPYQETEAVIDAYTLTDNDNSILTDNDNNTLTD